MTTMMEEVLGQPVALSGLRKFYASPGAIRTKALRDLTPHWPPTVVFTGMGSSLFAAYPAQAFLTSLGIRALVWEAAELVHHHLGALKSDTLLVAVSQSGETAEILSLLEALPKKFGLAAVVNVERSTLARRADLMLPMMAGAQESVSTRTYMCAVAALMYLAHAIAGKPSRPLTSALRRIVEAQERILERRAVTCPPTLQFLNEPPYLALMARGADLASAYQGAQMFKEVARLAAEPISAAQFRHGPIEILNPQHRYVLFARQGKTGTFVLRLARDIQSHGGRVLLLTDLDFPNMPGTRVIPVERVALGLGTLVDVLHIQLIVHGIALRARPEPGEFWIADRVTREE
jgi:glucosamine--fructose-6-phosphate aminotransferase (isomerizing)